ncbi:MAG TPA: D-aminoacylase [Microlunatus sp.]
MASATESVLITGGTILDGTGTAPLSGSLLIKGDRIAGIVPADARPAADRVIDASDRVITPGFIDLHSHADFTIQATPGAESQLHQGVTTLLTGNCGFSPFPVIDQEALIAASAFVGGDLDWSWTDAAGFADACDQPGMAINLALQVGHHALRIAAMGADQREPTATELERMRELLRRAAAQGAYGFSTGLIYAPGSYASTAEVDALVAEAGGQDLLYSTHIRNEGDHLLDAVKEAIRAARLGSARLEISHLKAMSPRNFGRVNEALELIAQARDEGLDVGCDVYPYDASSTTLTARLPGWALDGGIPALLHRLADPDDHERLVAELTAAQDRQLPADRVRVATGPEFGSTLAEIAERRTISPAEATLQVLQEQHGSVSVINHGMSPDDVRTVLRHPLSSVASDGWIMAGPQDNGWQIGHPHPRNFGTFTRVLGHYSRDEQALDLPEAVRKMTSLPASRLGLADRGLLRPGAVADVVVLDPGTVADRASYDQPWQLSRGVSDVWVGGVAVLTDGRSTGARPGRVLRRRTAATRTG